MKEDTQPNSTTESGNETQDFSESPKSCETISGQDGGASTPPPKDKK